MSQFSSMSDTGQFSDYDGGGDILQVEHDIKEDVCVVTPRGDVDASSRDVLKDFLFQLIQTKSHKLFVVDFSKVTFADTTGMGALVEARKELMADGGGLILVLGGIPDTGKISGVRRPATVLSQKNLLEISSSVSQAIEVLHSINN